MDPLTFNPSKELQIYEDARLVIHERKSNQFILKEIIKNGQVLMINSLNKYMAEDIKYKYQVINNKGKWQDTEHGYFKLRNDTKLSDTSKVIDNNLLLKMLHYRNSNSIKQEVFLEADEKSILYCMRHILLDSYKLLGVLSKDNILTLKEYLLKFSERVLEESSTLSYYHSLMSCLTYYLEYTLNNTINNTSEALSVLEQSWSQYPYKNNKNNKGLKAGYLVTKANILSAYDRSMAFETYQKILNQYNDIVKGFLSIEAITTYFLLTDSDRDSFQIKTLTDGEVTEKNINICFSADNKYFKMYALNWLQSSQFFRNVNYNYGLVVDNEDEYNELVKYYKDLQVSYSKFTGIDVVHNTRFFKIEPNILNKTAYACARFKLALYLLENYKSDVYITDIDQYITGDFEGYLLKIFNSKNYDIYLPEMKGVYHYLPGRRYLAGNIYIKNNEVGIKYAKTLVSYTSKGLGLEHSWMLDQSATRYASEIFNVGDLKQFGIRPLEQSPSVKRIIRKHLI